MSAMSQLAAGLWASVAVILLCAGFYAVGLRHGRKEGRLGVVKPVKARRVA